MKIKSFCKNQREVAQTINEIIDAYWDEDISENDMIITIEKIYENNNEKIVKNGTYTKILQQQCGKKRLDVISKILDIN